MDAVTPLWDLPQAQLLSDLDDLLGQAHDLPQAHNAALLTKIALQCGSADEEKTAFAVLDRVVTQATHLPVSYRVAVLEAVAQQMAYLGEDQSLEPQRLALFKRLTNQCAQMDGNAIPKLVDFLAQARRWLGQSEASDATFFTVRELVVKLQEQHRPEPLTVLAEYLLSVSERQRWLAFQAIADMSASNGDALVELTAKVRYMPLGVRAAAFDKALTTVARWHPDDLADASFELSKAIPSFKGALAQQKFDKIAEHLDQLSPPDAARVASALLVPITMALPKDAAPAAFDRVEPYLAHLSDDEEDRGNAVIALSNVAAAMPTRQADVARRWIRQFQTD